MSRLPRDDERVARVLDGDEPPRDLRAAGMVAVVERLRDLGREALLDPEPQFRAALRERLLAQAPVTLPHPRMPDGPDSPHAVLARTHHRSARAGAIPAPRPGGVLRPPRASRSDQPYRTRRRVLVATALIGFAVSASTMLASGDALPGQKLYGLKRTIESVETSLVRDDAERGRRHLRLARARAEEIGTLAASPGHTDDLVDALNVMDGETKVGFKLMATAAVTRTDPKTLAELTAWVGEQRVLVDHTWPELPGEVRQRVGVSLRLLRSASSRASALAALPRCECPDPPADELGPLPMPCVDCPPPAKGMVAGTPAETVTAPAASAGGAPPGRGSPAARTTAPAGPPRPSASPSAGATTGGPAPPGLPPRPTLGRGGSPPPSSARAPAVPTAAPPPQPPQPPLDDVTGMLDEVGGILPGLLGG